MPSCPVPNDGRATPKAEEQDLAPQQGGVSAPLAPATTKKGLEGIEDAVAGQLLAQRRVAGEKLATNRLAVGAQLGGDPGD